MTDERKKEIDEAIKSVIKDYHEVLERLSDNPDLDDKHIKDGINKKMFDEYLRKKIKEKNGID